MKIAFFMGSVDISGGSYVIYQHALFAQQAGHDVTVVVLYPFNASQMGWHPATNLLRFVSISDLGSEIFDLAIATWWRTATELHAINAGQYAYFVQSIESRFYPEHEQPLRRLVDSTYELGLPTVTEATWIQNHLAEYHGNFARLVRNGIRKDLYTINGPPISDRPKSRRLRVLVEGPFGVAFKNVGNSLRLSRRAGSDSTWLLSSSDLRWRPGVDRCWYPGVDRVFSRVPIESVPGIYRSCDVILKLSYVEGMFGPPLEMFHCGGTAVVYDVTGHDEYIENGVNALVLPRDDEKGVRLALERLRDDVSHLQKLKDGAIATAEAWPDWSESSACFELALKEFVRSPSVTQSDLRERNQLAMAEYVRDENLRLATLPPEPTTWEKIRHRIDSVPRLAHYRRLTSYILEGWP